MFFFLFKTLFSKKPHKTVTIWNETIFIGVGWNQCDQGCIWRNYHRPGLLPNNTPWYLWTKSGGEFHLNEDISRLGAVGLRVLGTEYRYLDNDPVAAGWTCAAEQYGDGTCDCGCGLPDVDCGAARKRVGARGCASGDAAVCVEGKCVEPGWDAGVCSLSRYGDGNECDCGCGAAGVSNALIDPDCWNPGLARRCPRGRGVCNAEEGFRCERGWTCNASEYGDGVCTCGRDCGIADPDCADAARPTTCDAGDTMVCVDNECRYPRRYTCPGLTYRDGRTCNCNCTVADPDCATVFHSVVGGPDDGRLYSCDTRAGGSTCVPAFCGNGFVDRVDGEECDGGTGCTDCRCVRQKGYRAKSPPDVDCEPVCGDGLVRDPEECEPGHAFCDNASCRCLPGHGYSAALGRCSGCGNHRVEPERGEQCDGGAGCDPASCRCAAGYEPLDPLAPACRRRPVSAAAIAVPVVVVAVAATAAALTVLYCRRWRHSGDGAAAGSQGAEGASGVVLMEVGEDGALKVAPHSAALSASGTAGAGTATATATATGAGATTTAAAGASQPGVVPGQIAMPPGTVTGGFGVSLASVAGTTTSVPQPPPYAADPSLCATQAIPAASAGDDPALAQTMFIGPQH